MAFVYTLSDPRTNEVRYVGQTAESLETRLRKHCWPSTIKREPCHRTHWIASLLAAGTKPLIEMVEEISTEAVDETERFYIEYFRSLGFRLVNQQPGGDGWPKGMKRRPHTEAEKLAVSATLKGRPKPLRTKEHARNLGMSNIGRRVSAETKKKLSESSKKTWMIRKNHKEMR